MNVLFASGKGGTGKSTLAVQMARERAAQGREVLLIETDQQQSAAMWAAIRVRSKFMPSIPCISLFGEGVADQIRAQMPKYDDIVIDTRGTGSTNVEMYEAMTVAHTLISPIKTSLFDSAATTKMDSLVKLARGFNPALKAFILVNGASTNAKSTREQKIREALEGLENYDGILNTRISHRQIFELVAEEGRAVSEFGRDQKAIAELTALAAEVWA
ncbi:AAA family ATPase [Paraburkholderia sp. MM6662-R1]|uniref:AAA family ATPase n=1 Tax=Paraburkholderia sp. MM6662-R1 TaxID=2991066 RepID=UPI003D1EDD3E